MTEMDLAQLAAIVGERNVLTEPQDMAGHLIDWRARFRGKAAAVVRPANTQEVSALMAWATANRCVVVPQGGNTGLNGGAIPDESGKQLILALGRMRSVRSIDPINDTIVVDAGCTLSEVQAAAEEAGRLFPLSLGSEGTCQIGGNIATNAGGLEVLRYGSTRELVLGLEVVLANGDVLAQMPELRSQAAFHRIRGHTRYHYRRSAQTLPAPALDRDRALRARVARSRIVRAGKAEVRLWPAALDVRDHERPPDGRDR
ncbi:MAG: FAD-binding oxidoreductase [Alphaproteobacteria bacterium]|nr:FAD-binding oxidoreductase [Alphaproteobacteria bacterium]